MHVNRYDSIPLYSQVAARIRELIKARRFGPDEEIPSEGEMEKEFGVSRITIRRAIDELVSEGLLVKARGKRTCMAPLKIDQPLGSFSGYSDIVAGIGLKPETKYIEITREILPQHLEELLKGAEFSRNTIRIKRIRMVDGMPTTIIISYVPEELVPGLLGSSLTNGSLFQTLAKRYGIVLNTADQIIEAVAATAEFAGILMIRKGFPLLIMKQLTYNQEQRLVEVVEVLSRADRYRYHTQLVPFTPTPS